ncbi:hypothetical protein J577_0980 [Acinetobacter sp. 263903-1]|nr:hypothetical protein J520_2297 [Acinetobacter sp. 869535]KCX38183.1 hypothetical protein J577_0980 [Acinetobacter sp. 263903-1]
MQKLPHVLRQFFIKRKNIKKGALCNFTIIQDLALCRQII